AEACGGLPRATLKQFADWELRSGPSIVAAGSSDVNCLSDEVALPGSGAAVFTCSAQGLSPGFASTPPREGVCAFPDVSGFGAGSYSMKVRFNPSGQIAESRLDNNSFELGVTLPDTRCRGAWCGAMCCPPHTACNAAGGCGLPDLTVNAALIESSKM